MNDKYIIYYNNFIDILLTIFKDDSVQKPLSDIKLLSDDIKLTYGFNFNNSINTSNFKNFLDSNIKLVSHKNEKTLLISQSLFDNKLYLKDILNNQPTDIKKIIWLNLHTLYLHIELLKSNDNQNKIQILLLQKLLNNNKNNENNKNNKNNENNENNEDIETIENNDNNENDNIKYNNKDNNIDDTTKTIKELLNVNVNSETNDMLDDIVNSFQDILSGDNPMKGIFNVSQQISTKYADNINNGNIQLDKIMESITKKVPALNEMMKMMPTNNTVNKQSNSEQYIMDENFSTASVPVGNNTESSNDMNLGNILKMADNIGIIPNISNNNNNNNNDNNDNNINIPGMDKLNTLFDFVNKMDKSQDPETIDNVKNEMNTFFQDNLGIDINKFNDDINKLM